MFGIIKLKRIMIVAVLILLSAILSVRAVKVIKIEASPKAKHVIVIDAGHGGRDVN